VRISPPLVLDAEEAATGLEIIAAALDWGPKPA
jgi:4-aminobutyrate aminotransferase-like enzyme